MLVHFTLRTQLQFKTSSQRFHKVILINRVFLARVVAQDFNPSTQEAQAEAEEEEEAKEEEAKEAKAKEAKAKKAKAKAKAEEAEDQAQAKVVGEAEVESQADMGGAEAGKSLNLRQITSQPALHSEFQESQAYTENHCLKKQNNKNNKSQSKMINS